MYTRVLQGHIALIELIDWVNFVVEMMNVAFKMMDFVFKMMNSVLKMMLIQAVFPGFVLNAFAKRPLWELGLTYAHGTGHGVVR